MTKPTSAHIGIAALIFAVWLAAFANGVSSGQQIGLFIFWMIFVPVDLYFKAKKHLVERIL
jgi:hypothetical protein